jgi:hypothetical protein
MAPVASAPRTTVHDVAAAQGAVRMAPPSLAEVVAAPTALGARLRSVPVPDAPVATRPAAGARATLHLDAGVASSAAEQRALATAAGAVVEGGVVVAAGDVHVWDLPGDWTDSRVEVSGAPGTTLRVSGLNRSGSVLVDVELVLEDKGEATVALVDRVVQVVVACFGQVPVSATSPVPPTAAGGIAATGWQLRNRVTQVASQTALCRGGWLTTSTRSTNRRRRANRVLTIVPAATIVRPARVVETALPITTEVVAVVVELADVEAADRGDLAVAVDGATCSAPVETAGRRQHLICYDVTAREDGRQHLAVSVGSAAGWTVAGVVGLPGRAAEWAARFSTSIPDDLVPDRPVTAGGSCLVRLSGTTDDSERSGDA